MGIKKKLLLINRGSKRNRIARYVFYAIVIVVILGAILLPASAEKTAFSVTLVGYNLTASLPGGWMTDGNIPLSAAEWHGSIWPKAFYNGNSSIGVGVWTIPQNLKDSSNQAIIEE